MPGEDSAASLFWGDSEGVICPAMARIISPSLSLLAAVAAYPEKNSKPIPTFSVIPPVFPQKQVSKNL